MDIFISILLFTIVTYIVYEIYKSKKNDLKPKESDKENLKTDDSIIINRYNNNQIEKKEVSKSPSTDINKNISENIVNIPLNKEKKDFNPYHHQKKIEEADTNIKHLRKMFFEDGKSPAFIMYQLKKIEGLIFEEMVLTCLSEAGFRVWRSPSHTNDGGLDGMVFINDVKVLLQSKCWKGYINNQDVEEFSNLILKKSAQFGYFIHTGKTGPMSYSKLNNNAFFISGEKVLHLILQPKKSDFNGKTFLVPQLKELLLSKNH